MRLRDLLSEKRSHPEQNPHVSVEDALRPYRGDPDIYVSFTDDVGKNSQLFVGYASSDPDCRTGARPGGARNGSGPKVGINPRSQYLTTPAAVYAYPLRAMWEKIITDTVPWGRGRPFLQVLRARGPVLDLATYSGKELACDLAKLKPILDPVVRAQRLSLGKLVLQWRAKAHSELVGDQFWEVVQHAAGLLSQARHGDGGRADHWDSSRAERAVPAIWNSLLRKLGYVAVRDGGLGIIHNVEPHQVAFLSPEGYEVVDSVRNVTKDVQHRLPIALPSAPLKEQSLNEADWFDRSHLIQVLEKNKGRWIHFSRVPKIGVNPQSRWTMTGPYGVYLYPVEFLLQRENQRIADGQQFATDLPYYFLCDLDLSSPGLNLTKMSEADAERMAQANGYLPTLEEIREEGRAKSAGDLFWKTLRRLNDHKQVPWNRALHGLSWVLDESQIMYGHQEPHQIVVLNPRILSNISMHENHNAGWDAAQRTEDPRARHGAWSKVYADVLNGLKDLYGGAIRWQEDPNLRSREEHRQKPKVRTRAPAMPTLSFDTNGRSISITPIQGSMSHGFRLTFRNGRETDTRTVNADDMRSLSTAGIVEKLKGFIDEILGFESDLRFKPFMDEDVADHMIQEGIGRRGEPFTIETEVANDKRGGGVVIYRAQRDMMQGDVSVRTIIRFTVGPEGFGGSARIDLMGNGFIEAEIWGEDETDRDAFMEKLAAEFVEKLDTYERLYGPDNRRREPFVFRDAAQWQAFKGWLVFNSGLSFDGKLYSHLSEAAAAFNDYEDQDGLSWRIASIFRHR